jgi:hypothetical protein
MARLASARVLQFGIRNLFYDASHRSDLALRLLIPVDAALGQVSTLELRLASEGKPVAARLVLSRRSEEQLGTGIPGTHAVVTGGLPGAC